MGKTLVTEETMAEYLSVVDDAAAAQDSMRGALIPVLQQVQERIGYLPPEVMARIADRTGVSAAKVFGVASFYSQFRLEPVGKYVIKVCHGTACHVQGAGAITDVICEDLGIADGETTPDGKFTLESVACLGCCSLAPVMMIENETSGRLTPDSAREIVKNFGE